MVRGLRSATGVLGELLVTAGMIVGLFVVWELWWTDVSANREQAAIVQSLDRMFAHPVTGEHPQDVRFGQAFAILRIPRLGFDFARPVLEGTSHDILTRGVGHYPGTALPGALGNMAIAGHRTTYGRPFHDIDTLQPGDRIIVETQTAYTVYTVVRHVIVPPTQVSVVAPVPQHPGRRPTERWLTLTSCHPKYSARQRYVVFAKFQGTYPHDRGLPPGTLNVSTSRN
jgi:sortase A